MQINGYSFASQDTDAPDGSAGYHRLYSSGTDADRGPGRFEAHVTAISHATRNFGAEFGLPPRAWRDRNNARLGTAPRRPGTLDYILDSLA